MNDVEIWYLMIPIAMVFAAIAIVVFFWSVKSDQFEDLDRHGSNILFDDDEVAHQQAQRQVPQDRPKQGQEKQDDDSQGDASQDNAAQGDSSQDNAKQQDRRDHSA
ncbi:cbb3-type cytochrome oxidase maturation protein [Oceanisphaera litoralis]|uniref:cbb3-type cytochrome oxidase assembly protein CcoS n=1 Tax=Oceanisphaera litoralis TaxID=225144 RepID=UPI00195DE384|nr:cbb3-type cytochrome oxidase maturation protein [Oceanisphaera litoralis]